MQINFEKVNKLNEIENYSKEIIDNLECLLDEKMEMTGWVNYPLNYDKNEFETIKQYAKEIKTNAKIMVVIGIGGSYLGAKAGIDFLSDYYDINKNGIEIIFVGNGLSEKYLKQSLDYVKDKEFYINVISKSGGTLEPAVAFNEFKKLLYEKYGKEKADKRIIATTDIKKGLLKEEANINGYKTLVVPDNIGGRYSVLSAVGMLPLAVAGYDIDKILEGAKEAHKKYTKKSIEENDAIKYALIRNILYKDGKDIEVFSVLNPNMRYFTEWLKQLFGESECKQNKGIFPASLVMTADLHSMGQLMQDGKRNIFETFIMVEDDYIVNDRIKYNEKFYVNDLNEIALKGTEKAHYDGNVPIIEIKIKNQNENAIGELFYFFEMSCALSALTLGVNPFDQPGVEEYKKNIKEVLK